MLFDVLLSSLWGHQLKCLVKETIRILGPQHVPSLKTLRCSVFISTDFSLYLLDDFLIHLIDSFNFINGSCCVYVRMQLNVYIYIEEKICRRNVCDILTVFCFGRTIHEKNSDVERRISLAILPKIDEVKWKINKLIIKKSIGFTSTRRWDFLLKSHFRWNPVIEVLTWSTLVATNEGLPSQIFSSWTTSDEESRRWRHSLPAFNSMCTSTRTLRMLICLRISQESRITEQPQLVPLTHLVDSSSFLRILFFCAFSPWSYSGRRRYHSHFNRNLFCRMRRKFQMLKMSGHCREDLSHRFASAINSFEIQLSE